jgi:putative oxygen-independent coproporphyrinogen III oxidase
LSAPGPPGLYLHVPFCSAICPYCDFAVLTGGPARRAAFVDGLIAELGLWRDEAAAWGSFDTVYLGGGTPSALAPAELERLVAAVRRSLPMAADGWIGMEANPEDVSAESLACWRGLGVTMLSLWVQSFDAATRRFLGRRHEPREATGAVEMALSAGFATVSIDLIYGEGGSPESALARWRRDLEQAAALEPQHLSCYQLTLHEGTPFGFRAARGELHELAEDAQARLFHLTHEALAARGYQGYEVSNFARDPAHESRHNRKYWSHTPYLGLGPSAHSFDGGRRWWNERKLHVWEARLAAGERPVAGSETLTPQDLALEEVMLALRTAAGLDLAGFRRRHGFDIAACNRQLVDGLAASGHLEERDGRLVPTLAGLAVADSLARSFEIAGGG